MKFLFLRTNTSEQNGYRFAAYYLKDGMTIDDMFQSAIDRNPYKTRNAQKTFINGVKAYLAELEQNRVQEEEVTSITPTTQDIYEEGHTPATKGQYTMNEELEYTIKQQARAIDSQMERVASLVLKMQEYVNNGQYSAAARMLGTYSISGDMEGLTTALARYSTLLEVRHMVEE